jgi:outer membrane biosynthesis protein TonB
MPALATAQIYRRPAFGGGDPLLQRCALAASAAGIAFLIAVLVFPAPRAKLTPVEELPPRIARLILEKPKPVTPPAPAARAIAQAPANPIPQTAAVETPKPPPPRVRRAEAARLAADAGTIGRERATRAVAAQIERSTTALDKSLEKLTSSLATSSATTTTSAPAGRRRSRSVSTGRSGTEGIPGGAQVAGAGALVDLTGSTVGGSRIGLGTLEGVGGGTGDPDSPGGSGGSASGARPGVYRSNASLLAVIQKYAAGIQYCYGNELKRDPGLKGKLIVALTVAASGSVTEAVLVEDTVGSPRLVSCALSQIRAWQFPPIAEGTTAFQAPFVFTPPE